MRFPNAGNAAALVALIAIFGSEANPAYPQRQDTIRADLAQVAAALSKRYHTTVLIEPAFTVVGEAIRLEHGSAIEGELDVLTRRLPNAVWRRVHMGNNDRNMDVGRLASLFRALDRVPVTSIVLENRTTHRSTELRRDVRAGADLQGLLKTGADGDKLVYLVCKAGAKEDALSEDHAAALERELAALLDADPSLRPSAVRQSLTWWMNLDPAALQPLMQRVGAAGTQLWSGMEPFQREEAIEQFKQAVSSTAPTPGPSGAAGTLTTDAPDVHNYRDELERIAHDLSSRIGSQFAVDPAIFLTVRPKAPSPQADEDTALLDLIRPLKLVEWRCVTVRLPSKMPPLGPRRLAIIARSLGHLGVSCLAIEDTRTHRADVYRQDFTTPHVDRLSGSPMHLFYAAFASETGTAEAPARRFADLMQQEQQLMLGMDSAQLGQVMQQSARNWQSLGAAERERFMSLPIAAGLMAIWMPLQAKERAGK